MNTALEVSWIVCCVLFAIYMICKIFSLCLNDWMLHQFEIVPETKRVPVSPDGWCEGFAGVWTDSSTSANANISRFNHTKTERTHT